jgi:AcrR family transcriptional regulator
MTATRRGRSPEGRAEVRRELVAAAVRLFRTRGYEETTVDDIAAAVDVSQRTFFRYFAGKEDVVFFAHSVAEEHFVDLLRQRPLDEAPLEALRQAVLEGWDGIGEAIERIVPVELHMRTYRLIESTPTLFATHLRRSAELEEEIARIIAAREGLDVDTDPRPRVAVAVFGGVIRVTERLWSAGGDPSVAAIRELTASYLDALRPALADKWRAE